MKKILSIATLCLIICHLSFSQKIWYKDEGYIAKKDDTTIKSIHMKTFSKDIILKMKNGDRIRLKGDTLWGYEEEGSGLRSPIRIIGFDRYEMFDYEARICLYMIHIGRHYAHYFSVTPTSEILFFDKKNLLKAYNNDSCYVQDIIQEKWFF